MSQFIKTKRDDELLSYDFLMQLADAISALGLSRQRTTDWLAETIYSSPQTIVDGQGVAIKIYDEIFDDAYGADTSFCWNSNVKRFADRRPQRRPKKSMLLRMQLFDAAFKILGRPIELPAY